MPLSKIVFRPGINKEGTKYTNENGWWDSDKVRFRKGKPEQIGGWVKYMTQSYKGVARSLFDWATVASFKYLGIGTNLKFYIEIGDLLSDITPLRKTTATGAVTFAMKAVGTTTLIVTDVDHGIKFNDYVTYYGAVSLGENINAAVLNQEYSISAIIDDDNYEIEAKNVAGTAVLVAAGDTGDGGSAIVGEYQIHSGTNSYAESAGWGSGPWSSGVWGGGNVPQFGDQLRLYSQSEFGDDLIFCARGGGVFYWQEATGKRVTTEGDITFAATTSDATLIVTDIAHEQTVGDYVTYSNSEPLGGNITSNVLNQRYRVSVITDLDNYEIEAKGLDGAPVLASAADTGDGGTLILGVYEGTKGIALPDMSGASEAPIGANQVMVSPVDRHVLCFGVNPIGSTEINPLLIRWSDQESALDWNPNVTSSAGGQVLSTGSSIVAAIKTRHEILVFTDTSIHSMSFSGAPFVFQFSPISENVSLISPNAVISAGDAVFFMDREGFYIYQGAVSRLPCDVYDFVFSNIDLTQAYKVFATNNPDDSEVTWFYPSGDAGSDINRYVTFNYTENIWMVGSFERGAWIQASTKNYPVASSNNIDDELVNYLYTQEFGNDAEGENIGGYIESGELSISDGDSFMFIKRFIPDFRYTGNYTDAAHIVTIKGSDFPLQDTRTLSVSTIYPTSKQSHIRVRSREIVLRIDNVNPKYGWTMGDFRFDMRTAGRR